MCSDRKSDGRDASPNPRINIRVQSPLLGRDASPRRPQPPLRFPSPRPALAGRGIGRGASTFPNTIAPFFVPFVFFCSNSVPMNEVLSVASVKSVVNPSSRRFFRVLRSLATLRCPRLCVSLFPLRPQRLCARIHSQRRRATPVRGRLFVSFCSNSSPHCQIA